MGSTKTILIDGVPCCCFCTLDSISAVCHKIDESTCSPCNFLLEWTPADIKDRASWSSAEDLPQDDPIRWRCGTAVEFWAPYWIKCGGLDFAITSITVTVTCGEGEPLVVEGQQTAYVQLPGDCGCEGCHIDVEVVYTQTAKAGSCCADIYLVGRVDKPEIPGPVGNTSTCADCAVESRKECVEGAWESIPTVSGMVPIPSGGVIPACAATTCLWQGGASLLNVCESESDGTINANGDMVIFAGLCYTWAGPGNVVTAHDWFVFGEVVAQDVTLGAPLCRADAGWIDTYWGHNASDVNLGVANSAEELCAKIRQFMVGKSMTTQCTSASFPRCANYECNVELTATVVGAS